MSENRKQALVAYLAALFGVAFVVVLISLVIQINQGRSVNATAADKVLSLQDEVQELQTENREMSGTIADMRGQIQEIQEGAEYLEGVAYASTARIQELEQAQLAYECLVQFQNAYFSNDMAKLEELDIRMEEMLPYLDAESQQAYNLIKEQLVQPTTAEE